MSDSMFTAKNTASAMLNARLNRVEGAIPYIRHANQVYTGSKVLSPAQNAVNVTGSGVSASGLVNPSTGLIAVGNAFPFTVQGNFGFTSTPNSITLYWDGTNGSKIFVIKRVDGTSLTIPSGSLLVSGLSPMTQYGFLPYNKTTTDANMSFTVGDSGSPMFSFSPSASPQFIAQATQNQDMADNESFTQNLIYYSTTAASVSSGQGAPGTLSPYSNVRDAPQD